MLREKISTFESYTWESRKIQQKETELLEKTLWGIECKYEINYTEMKKIIKEYFKKLGRNVNIQFENHIDDDRFCGTISTIITLIEETEILGIKKPSKTNITHKQLEDIIASALELEGKQLVCLENNVSTSSRCEGFFMDEHIVEYITWRTFTITVKR